MEKITALEKLRYRRYPYAENVVSFQYDRRERHGKS